jgi:hypothetical protein
MIFPYVREGSWLIFLQKKRSLIYQSQKVNADALGCGAFRLDMDML